MCPPTVAAVFPEYSFGSASLSTRKFFLLTAVGLLGLAAGPLTHGQATGSFSGAVSDNSGANISGATVTATAQATGIARTAKTDDAGHYLIPLLPVGIYTVRVDTTGSKAVNPEISTCRLIRPAS